MLPDDSQPLRACIELFKRAESLGASTLADQASGRRGPHGSGACDEVHAGQHAALADAALQLLRIHAQHAGATEVQASACRALVRCCGLMHLLDTVRHHQLGLSSTAPIGGGAFPDTDRSLQAEDHPSAWAYTCALERACLQAANASPPLVPLPALITAVTALLHHVHSHLSSAAAGAKGGKGSKLLGLGAAATAPDVSWALPQGSVSRDDYLRALPLVLHLQLALQSMTHPSSSTAAVHAVQQKAAPRGLHTQPVVQEDAAEGASGIGPGGALSSTATAVAQAPAQAIASAATGVQQAAGAAVAPAPAVSGVSASPGPLPDPSLVHAGRGGPAPQGPLASRAKLGLWGSIRSAVGTPSASPARPPLLLAVPTPTRTPTQMGYGRAATMPRLPVVPAQSMDPRAMVLGDDAHAAADQQPPATAILTPQPVPQDTAAAADARKQQLRLLNGCFAHIWARPVVPGFADIPILLSALLNASPHVSEIARQGLAVPSRKLSFKTPPHTQQQGLQLPPPTLRQWGKERLHTLEASYTLQQTLQAAGASFASLTACFDQLESDVRKHRTDRQTDQSDKAAAGQLQELQGTGEALLLEAHGCLRSWTDALLSLDAWRQQIRQEAAALSRDAAPAHNHHDQAPWGGTSQHPRSALERGDAAAAVQLVVYVQGLHSALGEAAGGWLGQLLHGRIAARVPVIAGQPIMQEAGRSTGPLAWAIQVVGEAAGVAAAAVARPPGTPHSLTLREAHAAHHQATPLRAVSVAGSTRDPALQSVATTPRSAAAGDVTAASVCPGSAVKHQNPLFDEAFDGASELGREEDGEEGGGLSTRATLPRLDSSPSHPARGNDRDAHSPSASSSSSSSSGEGSEEEAEEEEEEEGAEGEEADQVGELRDPRTDAEWDDDEANDEEREQEEGQEEEEEEDDGLAAAAAAVDVDAQPASRLLRSSSTSSRVSAARSATSHGREEAGAAVTPRISGDGRAVGADAVSTVTPLHAASGARGTPGARFGHAAAAMRKPRALFAGLMRGVSMAVHRGAGHVNSSSTAAAVPEAAPATAADVEGRGIGEEGGGQVTAAAVPQLQLTQSPFTGNPQHGGTPEPHMHAHMDAHMDNHVGAPTVGELPVTAAAASVGGGPGQKWAGRLGSGSARWASKVMNRISSMRVQDGVGQHGQQEVGQLTAVEAAALAAAQRAVEAAQLAAQLQQLHSALTSVQSLAQQVSSLRTMSWGPTRPDAGSAAAQVPVTTVPPVAAGGAGSGARMAAHMGLLHAVAAELSRVAAHARQLAKRCAALPQGPLNSRGKRGALLAHLAQLSASAQECASESGALTRVAITLRDLTNHTPCLTEPHLVHLLLAMPVGVPLTWVRTTTGIGSRRATEASMSSSTALTQLPVKSPRVRPVGLDTSAVQQLAGKALRMAARGSAPLDAVLLIPQLLEHAGQLGAHGVHAWGQELARAPQQTTVHMGSVNGPSQASSVEGPVAGAAAAAAGAAGATAPASAATAGAGAAAGGTAVASTDTAALGAAGGDTCIHTAAAQLPARLWEEAQAHAAAAMQTLVPQIAAAAWSAALTASAHNPRPASAAKLNSTQTLTPEGNVDPMGWVWDMPAAGAPVASGATAAASSTAASASAAAAANHAAVEATAAQRRAHAFVQQLVGVTAGTPVLRIAGQAFDVAVRVWEGVACAVAASAHVLLERLERSQDAALLVDVQRACRQCEDAVELLRTALSSSPSLAVQVQQPPPWRDVWHAAVHAPSPLAAMAGRVLQASRGASAKRAAAATAAANATAVEAAAVAAAQGVGNSGEWDSDSCDGLGISCDMAVTGSVVGGVVAGEVGGEGCVDDAGGAAVTGTGLEAEHSARAGGEVGAGTGGEAEEEAGAAEEEEEGEGEGEDELPRHGRVVAAVTSQAAMHHVASWQLDLTHMRLTTSDAAGLLQATVTGPGGLPSRAASRRTTGETDVWGPLQRHSETHQAGGGRGGGARRAGACFGPDHLHALASLCGGSDALEAWAQAVTAEAGEVFSQRLPRALHALLSQLAVAGAGCDIAAHQLFPVPPRTGTTHEEGAAAAVAAGSTTANAATRGAPPPAAQRIASLRAAYALVPPGVWSEAVRAAAALGNAFAAVWSLDVCTTERGVLSGVHAAACLGLQPHPAGYLLTSAASTPSAMAQRILGFPLPPPGLLPPAPYMTGGGAGVQVPRDPQIAGWVGASKAHNAAHSAAAAAAASACALRVPGVQPAGEAHAHAHTMDSKAAGAVDAEDADLQGGQGGVGGAMAAAGGAMAAVGMVAASAWDALESRRALPGFLSALAATLRTADLQISPTDLQISPTDLQISPIDLQISLGGATSAHAASRTAGAGAAAAAGAPAAGGAVYSSSITGSTSGTGGSCSTVARAVAALRMAFALHMEGSAREVMVGGTGARAGLMGPLSIAYMDSALMGCAVLLQLTGQGDSLAVVDVLSAELGAAVTAAATALGGGGLGGRAGASQPSQLLPSQLLPSQLSQQRLGGGAPIAPAAGAGAGAQQLPHSSNVQAAQQQQQQQQLQLQRVLACGREVQARWASAAACARVAQGQTGAPGTGGTRSSVTGGTSVLLPACMPLPRVVEVAAGHQSCDGNSGHGSGSSGTAAAVAVRSSTHCRSHVLQVEEVVLEAVGGTVVPPAGNVYSHVRAMDGVEAMRRALQVAAAALPCSPRSSIATMASTRDSHMSLSVSDWAVHL